MISRGALGALLHDHLSAKGCPVASPSDPRVPTSVEGAEDFGRLLARFHAAVDDFTPPRLAAWTRLHPHSLVGADAGWIERTYAHDPEDRARLVEWRAHAVDRLAEHPGTDVGMCHGEAYPGTCRYAETGLAIAELDWAGEGDRAYDLATYRWVLALHAPDQAEHLFSIFVTSYATVRALPDLRVLNGWVAARHLWSLRLAAGFADPPGLARRAQFASTWSIDG